MLKEPVFKGLVSRVAASPFKQQLVLLQEDITRENTQSPPSSAAYRGPGHQRDIPATLSGQQKPQRSQESALCTHEHWQWGAARATLHTHQLRAIPREAEKSFISSMSLSCQRSHPSFEMFRSQSCIIALNLQRGCVRYRALCVQTRVFGPLYPQTLPHALAASVRGH